MGVPTSIVNFHFFSAGIRPLELDMFVRNDLRRKVNQRRIQVVEIGVLISIIGFPMLGAWFRHFYRHLQWAKMWAAGAVQTHCSLLSSAIHITICATRMRFQIRTFESQGSGSAPVLANNIQFLRVSAQICCGKIRECFNALTVVVFAIFLENLGVKNPPPPAINRVSLWIPDVMT